MEEANSDAIVNLRLVYILARVPSTDGRRRPARK